MDVLQTEPRLLTAARSLTLGAGMEACWEFVQEGIKRDMLRESDLDEVIGDLGSRVDLMLYELSFEFRGDDLRVCFLDACATCSAQTMITVLEELQKAVSATP